MTVFVFGCARLGRHTGVHERTRVAAGARSFGDAVASERGMRYGAGEGWREGGEKVKWRTHEQNQKLKL